jgi:hypothetical protein
MIALEDVTLDPASARGFEERWEKILAALAEAMAWGASLSPEMVLATEIELSGRLITEGIHLAIHLHHHDEELPKTIISAAIEAGCQNAERCETIHGIGAPKKESN